MPACVSWPAARPEFLQAFGPCHGSERAQDPLTKEPGVVAEATASKLPRRVTSPSSLPAVKTISSLQRAKLDADALRGLPVHPVWIHGWRRRRIALWSVQTPATIFPLQQLQTPACPADRLSSKNKLTNHRDEKKFSLEPQLLAVLLPGFHQRRATPEKYR